MKVIAVVAFLAGLLLAVRVMLFGVRRRLDDEHLAHRRWPLALAAFFLVAGAMLYFSGQAVTFGRTALVVLSGLVAGAGAWWLVHHSAAIPSSDPEDDPRYRFQGHVARVTQAIATPKSGEPAGRITFSFDGKTYDLRARWTPGDWEQQGFGRADSEVVVERIEEDIAYVEPWAVVEQRL